MKTASTDGPSGLLAACPVFNIEMLYCKFFWGANKSACLLACVSSYEFTASLCYVYRVNNAVDTRRKYTQRITKL